jgi:hypothetical protein
MPGHGPNEPEHYDLHAWVWHANPDGVFAEFNPNVKRVNRPRVQQWRMAK